MYTIFEAPLQMMADNPKAYMKEKECTDLLQSSYHVYQTVALSGKVGEHVAIVGKKGDTWYVGAMTNWTARDIDLTFLF